MAKQTKNYLISPALQKVFVFSALAVFLCQLALHAQRAFVQYPDNSNLSAFYWLFLYLALLPVIFFAVAYWLGPRKGLGIANLFENIILTVSGLFVLTVVDLVMQEFQVRFIVLSDSFYQWFVGQAVMAGVVLLLYIVALITLRRSRG